MPRKKVETETDEEVSETAETKDVEKPSEKVKLVKMFREEEPFEADVHPHEVGSYAQGGWNIKQ